MIPADAAPPPALSRPHGWRSLFAIAACAALTGAVGLAIAEFVGVYALTARYFRHDPIALSVVAAILGKFAVSHLLVWLPLMLIVAAGYGLLGGRHPRRRPEAAIPAMLVLLSGLVVAPADLDLANLARPRLVAIACTAVVLAALAVYAGLHLAIRLAGARVVRRGGATLTVLAALVAVATGIAFFRSPLAFPAAFRLAETRAAFPVVGDRPHVLWIVMDTVRADRMGCYGFDRPTTPNVDALAAGGLLYEMALSSGNWTAPAHASMFTGLPIRQHHFDHHSGLYLPDDARTVADVLRENGYATGLFTNNPLVTRDTNLAQGFQRCDAVYHLRRLASFSLEALYERSGLGWPIPWLDGDYGGALTNQIVADWLGQREDEGKPTFVFINYMEAHLPYRVPRAYRRMFMDESQVRRSYALRWNVYGNLNHAFDLRFSIEGGDFSSIADREVVRRQYDACIRYVDTRIGEILDLYRARGMLDRTLVIVTTDHGEHLDTHGMWGHRLALYQDLCRVAMILREPGRTTGERRTMPAQLSDLYPTVLNFALGSREPAPAFGACDLLAPLDAASAARIAISEYNGPERSVLAMIDKRGTAAARRLIPPRKAAVDGRWKYVAWTDGTRELFDLLTDPGELTNLADQKPAEVERLSSFLSAWRAAVPTSAPWGTASGASTPEGERIMRSLGYIGGD